MTKRIETEAFHGLCFDSFALSLLDGMGTQEGSFSKPSNDSVFTFHLLSERHLDLMFLPVTKYRDDIPRHFIAVHHHLRNAF